MKNLLKNKWLLLIVGLVVLYFVYKKFGNGANGNGSATDTASTPPMPAPKPMGTDEQFDQKFSYHGQY